MRLNLVNTTLTYKVSEKSSDINVSNVPMKKHAVGEGRIEQVSKVKDQSGRLTWGDLAMGYNSVKTRNIYKPNHSGNLVMEASNH